MRGKRKQRRAYSASRAPNVNPTQRDAKSQSQAQHKSQCVQSVKAAREVSAKMAVMARQRPIQAKTPGRESQEPKSVPFAGATTIFQRNLQV